MKKCPLPLLLPAIAATAFAQVPSALSLRFSPGAQLPFGVSDAEGEPLYGIGYSATLAAGYRPGWKAPLELAGALSYARVPLAADPSGAALGILSLGAGPAAALRPAPNLELGLSAEAGYSLLLFGSAAATPFAAAGAGLSLDLGRSLSIGIAASYRAHFGAAEILYQGLGASLGLGFRLGSAARRPLLEIRDPRIDPVFPVFYQRYDDHPLGRVRLRNGERGAIEDLRVSFFAPKYMGEPKPCPAPARLERGQDSEIGLYAIFSDSILSVTEGTKVEAKVAAEYLSGGERLRTELPLTLRVLNRNSMTWDDDRRAAAFVTARDPTIMRFAKTVAGQARESGPSAACLALRSAMGLFEALRVHGLRYVPDPGSPYSSRSAEGADFLQFPVQTLSYKAGDCDDLSILYASMMEAAGLESAFVTVPGHILVAFRLEAEEAAALPRPGDAIRAADRTWLPVEVTMVQRGFLDAENSAAASWREAGPAARLYPVRDAWAEYEPVAYLGSDAPVETPAAQAAFDAYRSEMGRFSDEAVKVLEPPILAALRQNRSDPAACNRLGILYARYGKKDEARAEFARAAGATGTGYLPALANLGNLLLLDKDWKGASQAFARALAADPRNLAGLAGSAQAEYQLGDLEAARRHYETLAAVVPAKAKSLAYIAAPAPAGQGRAAEAATVWPLWDGDAAP